MTNKNKILGTAHEIRTVEEALAKGVPARRQPGSGVYKGLPSDVVLNEDTLVECKVRAVTVLPQGAKHVSLDLGWVEKVSAQARLEGFARGIVVLQPKGNRKRYVIQEFDDWLDMLVSSNQPPIVHWYL